jgi:hypothetical protein
LCKVIRQRRQFGYTGATFLLGHYFFVQLSPNMHPKRIGRRSVNAACKVIRAVLTKGCAPDAVFMSGIFFAACIQMPPPNEYQETLN